MTVNDALNQQNKLTVDSEKLAYWYFRLNGCFTITNFVVHPDKGRKQKTEVDILAVRLPHREELLSDPMEDDPVFHPNGSRTKVILAEVTTRKACKINGPWTKRNEPNMQRVLQAAGAFPKGDSLNQAVQCMYEHKFYEDDFFTMTLFCIAKAVNTELKRNYPKVPQVTWEQILRFIYGRFKKYREQKCRHPQWDETGKALFDLVMNSSNESEFLCRVSIVADHTFPDHGEGREDMNENT